jgi:hypothetical protein
MCNSDAVATDHDSLRPHRIVSPGTRVVTRVDATSVGGGFRVPSGTVAEIVPMSLLSDR